MPKPVTVTIPSRLARTTVSSPNLAVAQARSRSLYRDWYRAAPEICQLYALDVPYPTLRAKIRQIFDRYAHVKDVQAIDVLIAKSHMEYQEFVNVWKMPSQVMRYFEAEQAPPVPNTFMEKFL
ncbi:hypothetical protein PCANC_11224 [Puccinia coronata f. sp. avenae]|nr:hypothetical protein PCANC_11224 [Puccinia coronata f. sp. avenae]PLW50717.1 hypothetical protein PCASD_00628 [Puccinia coronata f. sp. avenae]